MKKNVYFLLALAAALTAFAGCMSNEVEAARGPTPGIINLSY